MPTIHGHTYGELDDWALPSRELRVFVELATAHPGRRSLFDIDALRIFLRSNQAGCAISLLTAGPQVDVRREFAGLSSRILQVPDRVSPEVAALVDRVLAKQREQLGGSYHTIELAREADADLVIPARMPTEPSAHVLRRDLDMSVCNWSEAMRECEVFCRGHDVAWTFREHIWGMPFQGLYWFSEPPREIFYLRDAAAQRQVDGPTIELLRSYAMNRVPAVQFTRDRLLFYLQQRRRANRKGAHRSDLQFELDYYLNHYYLLLWGGLDQMCWIINGVLGLGIGDHEHSGIGVGKESFQELVREKCEAVYLALVDAEFVAWRKPLAAARHHAAHRGITLASQLYFAGASEPSVEEIDAEVDADPEWIDLVGTLGDAAAEESREVFRFKARLGRLEKAPERVMSVQIDRRPAFITPLVNVERDCLMFAGWSARIAVALKQHLA